MIRELNGHTPELGKNVWVAENATIIGEVFIGDECSIWFNAVIRGDVGSISIGNGTNIQDGAVLHTTTGKSIVRLGNNVTVGHGAIVHGCTTDNNVLIGMGSIVLDNAHLGEGSIVAAGAVVKENTHIPPGTIWAGVPAKQVKKLDSELSSKEMEKMALGYQKYKEWYL